MDLDRLRRQQRLCLIAGIALVLPTLGGGFFADDFTQIAQIEGWSANPAGALDLYSFVPRDREAVASLLRQGFLPYFTAPELQMAFFRPLSSALLALDHAVFGRWAPGYHAHSLLWFAALLLVIAALLRRVLPPTLATLALLVFCVDDAHAMAAGWVAARNATVACAFGFGALLAHIRWRSDGWRPGASLAPAALALALLAGEMGLAVVAYLAAWELLERRPQRWRALAPTLLVVLAYLSLYASGGWGARASGAYLDPLGDPATFLAALPERLLLLIGNLILGAPIDLAIFVAKLRPPLIATGAIAAVVVAFWLPRALARMPLDEARAVRWMGLGAAGALLVSAPALIGERVLLAAGVGGAVIVAALVRDAWWSVRRRRRSVPAWAGLLALALPNLLLAPLALGGKAALLGTMAEQSERLGREAEIEAPVPARVVVLAMGDLTAVHLPVLRAWGTGLSPQELRALAPKRNRPHELPLPDRIGYRGSTVLSLAAGPHRLVRRGPGSFELYTPEGTLLDGVWPQALRSPRRPLPAGSVVTMNDFSARVLADRDGRPTRVAFEFDRPLEDPGLVFLTFVGQRLRRFHPPAIGADVAVPQDAPLP